MRLQVVGGPQSGREIWVDQEMARVGSHPQADVRLENLAPHVATIQQRGKAVAVIARAECVALQGHPLSPGQAVAWKPGQEVGIGPDTKLRLLSAVDTPPEDEPWAWNFQAQSEPNLEVISEHGILEAKQETNSTLKLILCGCCITAALLMLLDLNSSTPAGGVAQSDFESVINALRSEAITTESSYLREVLQEGYFYRSRGDEVRASRKFSELRDRYLTMRKIEGFQINEVEQQIYHYVKTQLADLESAGTPAILN